MTTPSNVSKLTLSTRPQTVKVSRIRRHRLQYHGSSIKRKQSSNVVHVTTRSLRSTSSMNNKILTMKNDQAISSMEYELKKSATTQKSVDKPTSSRSLSIRQNAWEKKDLDGYSTDKQRYMNTHKKGLNSRINQTGSTHDHHRKKKKKNNKGRCICLCVCLLVALLCIVIATILGIILSRKPRTTIVTPPTVVSLQWNSSGITLIGIAGVFGTNASLLNNPYGMVFDSSNTLYIADYSNNRIQKLITDTSMCVTVAGQANGVSGTGASELYWPIDILLDSDDNIYITDSYNSRVQFWVNGATSGSTVAGIGGTVNIPLYVPSSIVADSSSGTFFISDTSNNRIISYPAGIVVAGGNGSGNADTQLDNPYGLVYDSISKSFLISNYGTNNIVRWTLGASSRTLVAGDMMGAAGSNSTFLSNPVGVTMDPMGNIYVADSSNHRIQFFLAGQSNATTIVGITGVPGTNSSQLNIPFWVTLDNQLNLYVADTFNHRVQKFLRY